MQNIVQNAKYEILTPFGWSDFIGVKREKKNDLVTITTSNNNVLTCTRDHLIKNGDGDFVTAISLDIGAEISTKNSKECIKFISFGSDNEEYVYDLLEVDKGNQYFTNNLISHNCEFQGSSGTLISGSTLKNLVHKTPITDSYKLSVYEYPVKGRTYSTVVDVSRGKGLDYSAFQIIDITKMPYKQVCVFRDNLSSPIEFAEIINRTCKAYNECAILIEINDIGEQVSELLQYDFEYENLLFTESAGRSGKRITGGFSGKSADKGIRTTKTVKSIGCSMLKLLIEQNQLIVNDYNTIKELSTFSKKGTSYEAESGCNDDLVMCLVLFAWLSDQKYFKELTDINTLAKLREKSIEDMENEMLSFGFIDDGLGFLRSESPTPMNYYSGYDTPIY